MCSSSSVFSSSSSSSSVFSSSSSSSSVFSSSSSSSFVLSLGVGYSVLQVSVWVFVIAMGGLGGLPPSRGGFGGAEPPLR